MYFFITCLTRLVNLRKTVQHFKQLVMFDVIAQVLVQNSTGHKKQSLNACYFLGLSDLYIMIESNWSNWMLRVDADGNVQGGWGRLISTGLSYIEKRYWCLFIIFAEVWRGGIRETPLQVTHAAKQYSPCFFLHENLWEPQSDLQLHLTDSSKDAWTAVRYVVTGRSLPCTSFQPQSCGWNATPLNCYTWW